MFQFIEFLKKRPSDKTIRLIRIIFWLLIVVLLWLYFEDLRLEFLSWWTSTQVILYIKYSLFILWVLPILFGILNPCIAKRKYIKIAQIVFWFILIILWNYITVEKPIVVTDKAIMQNNPWSINFADINNVTKTSKPINVWFYIAFIWLLQIIAWISGKCITSKCLKYWETITKIRV